VIALLLSLCLWTTDLERAERAYRLGQFEQALALYAQALPACEGREGGVLFNMGNCAHRLGRHAEAAWLFRRALLRLPGDAAALGNLALAERQLGLDPARAGAAHSSVDPWPWLLLATVLQGAGLAAFALQRGTGARRMAFVLVVLGLGAAARAAALQWGASPAGAVVLVGSALRAEPSEQARAGAACRPGDVVAVVARSAAWLQVEHAGATGWLEAGALGVVE
jgi:tetratricopeptide (TPR) repeat protein